MQYDVCQEVEDYQLVGFFFWDVVCLQVEQLFVVEVIGCVCVVGVEDVVGFDFEVWD